MPFGVDLSLYARYAGNFSIQTIDVAFTGTSDRHKYPLRTKVLDELATFGREEHWNVFIGSWTTAHRGPRVGSDWSRLRRIEYVQQIARAKMWVSTTGPDWIVGTRYFEVLAVREVGAPTRAACHRWTGACVRGNLPTEPC